MSKNTRPKNKPLELLYQPVSFKQNIQPVMKKAPSILTILLAASLMTLLPMVTKADSVTQFQTNSVTSGGSDFVFNTFNQQLGTLYAVTFSIVSSIDSGSFFVQNNNVGSILVKTPRDFLTVVDNQASGADYDGNSRTLATTPSTGVAGYSLAGNTSQTFTITPVSLIGVAPVDYDLSSFLSQYESAAGLTTVSFNASIAPSTTITGGSVTLDMSGVDNATTMSLTYSYTASPIPEPSTYALVFAGLTALAVVIVRRKKALAA